ncbi:hypothetical protein ABVT39_018230 [Epinephelus coioides]
MDNMDTDIRTGNTTNGMANGLKATEQVIETSEVVSNTITYDKDLTVSIELIAVGCLAAPVKVRKKLYMEQATRNMDTEKKILDKRPLKSATSAAERANLMTGEPSWGAKKMVERGGGTEVEMMAGGMRREKTATMGEPAKSAEERGEELAEDTRELVVGVEVEGEAPVSMLELLRAVEQTCGRVIGCRAKGVKKWELTMNNPRGKNRLLDGFKIGDNKIIASELARDQRIVSFLNLPLYITDKQICDKLLTWGVEPVSPIKRRKWAGTEVYDGTRYLKVKFSETITSLPYSAKFSTLEGVEYFRVIHDSQQRVCRLCLQPGHILRECPEFKCFKCHKIGHYARECVTEEEKCASCRSVVCLCDMEDAVTRTGQEEDGELSLQAAAEEEELEESAADDSLVEVEETAEEGTEKEDDSGEDFGGVPSVFRRPGRLAARRSSAEIPVTKQQDRSRSSQREVKGGGGGDLPAEQLRGRDGDHAEIDLDEPAKCTCKESGGDEEDEEVFNEKEADASAESFSGSEGNEEEEEMEQEGLCKGAGVAVMADLARAGPPEQEALLAGLGQAELIGSNLGGTVAADMGRRRGGGSGSEEDSELSSAQVPEGAAGSAGADALLGGWQGEVTVVPQTPLGGSSDTDMDLEMVKQVMAGRKRKKHRKS